MVGESHAALRDLLATKKLVSALIQGILMLAVNDHVNDHVPL